MHVYSNFLLSCKPKGWSESEWATVVVAFNLGTILIALLVLGTVK